MHRDTVLCQTRPGLLLSLLDTVLFTTAVLILRQAKSHCVLPLLIICLHDYNKFKANKKGGAQILRYIFNRINWDHVELCMADNEHQIEGSELPG